jgi:hypothetical protein
MKGKIMRKIAGFILMVLLVPGVALLSSTTAQAQHRGRVVIVRPFPRFHSGFGWYPYGYGYGYGYPYPYPYYGYYNNYVFGSSESAYDQGYRDGLKTGENDARRHQSYNPERSHFYRDAGYGNFGGEYRNGFVNGYENGFRA